MITLNLIIAWLISGWILPEECSTGVKVFYYLLCATNVFLGALVMYILTHNDKVENLKKKKNSNFIYPNMDLL